jgi:Gpi18-like mannosyltransferase
MYSQDGAFYDSDGWDEATHTNSNTPTGSRVAARRAASARQRGLPGWLALLVLLAIAGIGGVIDMISGSTVRGGFNIALVVASLVAILLVRHRDMFPIVVAPPLVYIVASVGMLYIRSGGLHNRKVLIDSAANWLVYGFPAIAGATAAVLIVGGIRLVIGR